jgi:Na+-transporting methylmalonyl-CoA/oxaloacetate decarboxylase gamma subunit
MIWMYPAVSLAVAAIAVGLFKLGAMSVWVSVLGFALKVVTLILLVVAMVVIARYVRRRLDKGRARRA